MNKLSKAAFLTRLMDKQGAKKKRKAQETAGYVQGRRTAYLRERKACPLKGDNGPQRNPLRANSADGETAEGEIG